MTEAYSIIPAREFLRLADCQAVIFDMDGVLADTEEFHLSAWIELVKTHSLETSCPEVKKGGVSDEMLRLIRSTFGQSNDTIIPLLWKKAERSIGDALATYGVDSWAKGFFGVSPQGEVEVYLEQEGERVALSLLEIVNEAQRDGLHAPLLLRFPDLLAARLERLNASFHNAMRRCQYRGRYRGVYPTKVNQQRQVIEQITHPVFAHNTLLLNPAKRASSSKMGFPHTSVAYHSIRGSPCAHSGIPVFPSGCDATLTLFLWCSGCFNLFFFCNYSINHSFLSSRYLLFFNLDDPAKIRYCFRVYGTYFNISPVNYCSEGKGASN